LQYADFLGVQVFKYIIFLFPHFLGFVVLLPVSSTKTNYIIFLSSRMVIGYDEGTIMIKMGREVPVASMDTSGKIIWAKHNEIQTVNIKSVGANFEVSSLFCKQSQSN
jgi:hypothetical protein